MKRTSPTPPEPSRPTFREMLEELIDLTAGLGAALLPLLLLSVPGIILFFVLPAILLLALAAPVALVGAVIAGPPYLVARWLRRRQQRGSRTERSSGSTPWPGAAVERALPGRS